MPLIKPIKSSIVNPTHPLAKGLVGCWLLNEGTGNKISDLSGHGNSGTIYGSPAWSAGPTGGCLEFVNGNSQYVNLGNSHFGMDKTNSLSIVTFACRTSSDPTYAPNNTTWRICLSIRLQIVQIWFIYQNLLFCQNRPRKHEYVFPDRRHPSRSMGTVCRHF